MINEKLDKLFNDTVSATGYVAEREKDKYRDIELTNGVPERRNSKKLNIMRYDFKDEKIDIDSANYKISLSHGAGALNIPAEVFSIDNKHKKIFISFSDEEDIEDTCYLKIFPIKIYEKIHEYLEENRDTFQENTYSCLLGESNPYSNLAINRTENKSLNESQKRLFNSVIDNTVTFLWGPPGTGKSHVLGDLAKTFFDNHKRVLIVSNTNLAVDSLLEKIKENIGSNEWNSKGDIIRLGNISPELITTLEDISLEKVEVEMLSELRDRYSIYNHRLLKVNSVYDVIQKEKNKLVDLDVHVKKIREVATKYETKSSYIESIENRIETKLNNIVRIEKEISDHEEKSSLKKTFSRFSKETKEREIDDNKKSIDDLNNELIVEKRKLKKFNEEVEFYKDKIEKVVPVEKYEIQLNEVTCKLEKISRIKEKINKIEKKISDEIEVKKNKIFENARILGTSCVQAILKNKYIGKFDLVLIDEASMVTAPLLISCMGLSSSRVVISGDFRQLAPIAPSSISKHDLEYIFKDDIFFLSGVVEKIDKELYVENLVMLQTQYRYPKVIGDFISKSFYRSELESVKDIDLENKPLTWVDTSAIKLGFINNTNFIHVGIVEKMIKAAGQEKKIGIITPYRKQFEKYKEIFSKHENVECGTVHKFQGSGLDIIIFDPVIGWGKNYSFFSKNKNKASNSFLGGRDLKNNGPRLINVAMTRAKEKFIMLGAKDFFEEYLEDSKLLDALEYIQEFGNKIDSEEILNLDIKLNNLTFEEKYMPKISKEDMVFLTTENCKKLLDLDIKTSKKQITIYSPFVAVKRIFEMLDQLKNALSRGVVVNFIIRPNPNPKFPESWEKALDVIKSLKKSYGDLFRVHYKTFFHQKFVFIDDSIFYCGSMNFLSNDKNEESVVRFNDQNLSLDQATEQNLNKGIYSNTSELFKEMDEKKCDNKNCNEYLVYNYGSFKCPTCD